MDSITGILKKDWFQLLSENRYRLHPTAWPKALVITLYSLRNNRYYQQEVEQFSTAIEATEIRVPPIFILGHWRSGTTFLQNLMTQDKHLVSPNIFECRNPHTFLTRQAQLERYLKKFEAVSRPTDNVKIGLDSPGEEEFAVGVMTLMTPLLGWLFPKKRDFYESYLHFENVSPEQLHFWKKQYVHFLKKITLNHQKQLLLKSPVNTARIRYLLELFPEAKFIHIHRHPFEVYRSTEKMYHTAVASASLQGNCRRSVEDDIIRHYKQMYARFFADKSQIPENQFLEIGFKELETAPLRTLEKIYTYFSLNEFSKVEPNFRRYIENQKHYQKNRYSQLPSALKQRLTKEWAFAFENWGYSVEETG